MKIKTLIYLAIIIILIVAILYFTGNLGGLETVGDTLSQGGGSGGGGGMTG